MVIDWIAFWTIKRHIMNQSRLLYLVIAGIAIFAAAYIVMKYILVKKKEDVVAVKVESVKTISSPVSSPSPSPLSFSKQDTFAKAKPMVFNDFLDDDGSEDEVEDDDYHGSEDDGEEEEEENSQVVNQKQVDSVSNYITIAPPCPPVVAQDSQKPVQVPRNVSPATPSLLRPSPPLPIGDERFPELNELCFPSIATPSISYPTNQTSMYTLFSNNTSTI